MQFCRVAARPQMMDTARESGLDVARAEQCQHRAFRIGVGNDRVALEALARLRVYAHDAAIAHNDPCDRLVRANVDARVARRLRELTGDAADAALRYRTAAVPACQPVQVGHDRIRRARAEVRSEYRVEAQRALQQPVRETLVELVVNVHADEPQELAHFGLAQPANIETELRERQQVMPAPGAQSRWRLVQIAVQQVRIARHAFVETPILVGVRVRDTVDLRTADADVAAVGAQSNGRHIVAEEFRLDAELPDDLGLQLVDEVRAGRNAVLVGERSRYRGAAYLFIRLEYQHRFTRFREQRSADEAVVAGADDDCIESFSRHPDAPQAGIVTRR